MRIPCRTLGVPCLLGVLLMPVVLSGLGAQEPPPVRLQWGVPEHQVMSGFAGLERNPQAEELSHDGDRLCVRWIAGRSYVVPIFAASQHMLQGIRYYGYDIPEDLELEWLDPWNSIWYSLPEIPAELIELEVFRSPEDDTVAIDFGPPTGAEFHPRMSRFIWFRVTPKQAGEFTIHIFGYPMQLGTPGERFIPDSGPSESAVADAASNELRLNAEVAGADENW